MKIFDVKSKISGFDIKDILVQPGKNVLKKMGSIRGMFVLGFEYITNNKYFKSNLLET